MYTHMTPFSYNYFDYENFWNCGLDLFVCNFRAYPLFKLSVRNPSWKGYNVDGCHSLCFDIYLECQGIYNI